jgi:hypothetical protein
LAIKIIKAAGRFFAHNGRVCVQTTRLLNHYFICRLFQGERTIKFY